MSVVYDIFIDFVTDVITSVLFVVLTTLLLSFATFTNFKMPNIDTENSVIEDDNNTVYEKTNSIKDNLIKEDKKNIVNIHNNDKKYEINGVIFKERHFKDDEKYIKFEIRDFKMASDDPSIDLTEQTEASPSTLLPLGIQKVPNGVIINSNVYLPDRNYHTIVSLDDGRGYCGVCDTDCDLESQDHINGEEHKNNLKSHVPLCKYDLCIIRKLQENYHCGVCNEIFDIKDSNEHFASKDHEDKLLFAVNRVSDIMYDLDIHRENVDCYHFDSHAINNVNVENDFGGFYDGYKPDYESSIETMSDVEEIENPFSYASMAKKPQITPKYIEEEIDGKIMHIRYDSWHMILSLKSNKYYCMVCKSDGHISLKIDHCMGEMHLSKLKKCTTVEQYIGFFIRKIDHRLYHCAHCNNLQLLIDIEDHINTRHKKRKIKNMTESPSKRIDLQNIENERIKGNTVFPLENEIIELHIFCAKFTLSISSYNIVVFSNFCCLCDKKFDEFKKHVIEVSHIEKMNRCPFLFKYDCNLIRLIKNGYHCAICNIIVQYELIDDHIIEEKHVQTLNKIITLSTNKKSSKDTENYANTSKNDNNSEEFTEMINEKLNGVKKIIGTDKNETILLEKDKKSIENDEKELNLLDKSKKSIEKDQNDSILMDESKKNIETDIDVENDDNLEDNFFNTEEFVFLKRKNVFAKVALVSYNTLVPAGDGTKYCALCSVNVDFDRLKKHTESRQHIDNMRKYKYLDKYEKHLLRQIFHIYHCSVCNVMFTYRELNTHLTWSIHEHELDKCHKIVKNNRKTDIKNGTKQITIDLQKEILYTIYIEPKIKIGIYYEFAKNIQEISKKSKIVINNGVVLKISWDSWNGFSKNKTGFKCFLCQKDIKTYEQTNHSKNSSHLQKVEENFLKEFNPALIRKINETALNCVTCNAEIPNKSHNIVDHIKGKKHKKIFELLIKDSTECNNYSDCTDDIFTLQ